MWVRDRKKEGDVRGSIPWKLQNPGLPRVPADGKVMDEANMLSLIIFLDGMRCSYFLKQLVTVVFLLKLFK